MTPSEHVKLATLLLRAGMVNALSLHANGATIGQVEFAAGQHYRSLRIEDDLDAWKRADIAYYAARALRKRVTPDGFERFYEYGMTLPYGTPNVPPG